MICKKILIPSLLLLAFLNFESYSQDQYIKKHYRGDDIPLDSFAVMDLKTYSGIRKGAELYRQLSEVDKSIIHKSDSIVERFNRLTESNNLKIDLLMAGIGRRDSVIQDIRTTVNDLQSVNRESLDALTELNKKQKKPWMSSGFWMGFGIGFIGATLILN